MPGCIFLLARFTLRVDQVLFRTFDTRLYHSFASSPPLVIKEVIGLEARYDDVKRARFIFLVHLVAVNISTVSLRSRGSHTFN